MQKQKKKKQSTSGGSRKSLNLEEQAEQLRQQNRNKVGFAFVKVDDYEKIYVLNPWQVFKHRVSQFFHPLVMMHPEIIDMETGYSYSIQNDGVGVYKKLRNFSNPYYRFYEREYTEEQHRKIFAFLEKHVKRHTPFNDFASVWNFSPFTCCGLFVRDTNKKSFFCSELVAHALIAGGVYTRKELNPALTTPDSLFAKLNTPEKLILVDSFQGGEGAPCRDFVIEMSDLQQQHQQYTAVNSDDNDDADVDEDDDDDDSDTEFVSVEELNVSAFVSPQQRRTSRKIKQHHHDSSSSGGKKKKATTTYSRR